MSNMKQIEQYLYDIREGGSTVCDSHELHTLEAYLKRWEVHYTVVELPDGKFKIEQTEE